jgi:hypothetical protein
LKEFLGSGLFFGISFEKLLCKTIASDKRMNKKIAEAAEEFGTYVQPDLSEKPACVFAGIPGSDSDASPACHLKSILDRLGALGKQNK